MMGYYVELGYDVLTIFTDKEQKLVPFFRYENYNTHQKVPANTTSNPAYHRTDITSGLGYWFTEGAVVKADYQWFLDAGNKNKQQVNIGIGFMF